MNTGIKLPGNNSFGNFPDLRAELANGSLGSILSAFFGVAFYVIGFLSFFWFAWGVFEYIFAGGKKEALASARKRMTWAIVGLVMFVLSFVISQYAETIFNPTSKVTNVREVKSCGADEYWDVSGKCQKLKPLDPAKSVPLKKGTEAKPAKPADPAPNPAAVGGTNAE